MTKVEALGKDGGAGNLIFSEVVKIHVDESVLNEAGGIDQHKIDLVARMGGNWYSRANQGMFEVPKPLSSLGIGVDQIPEHIRNSDILSGNDLGMLGNVEEIPSKDEVADFLASQIEIRSLLSRGERNEIELKVKTFLQNKDVLSAWKVLLAK